MSPALTVIMPTWNKAKYIREALDSVFAQKTSYPYHIIIADDCSTDGTLGIVAEYERAHPGAITVLGSERNRKLFRNVVRAYAVTTTPYFCVLDPDDYWRDDGKVQRALDFLEAHRDFTVYAANSLVLEPDGSTRPHVPLDRPLDFGFVDYLNGRGVMGQTAGVVYRNVVFPNGTAERLSGPLRPDQERTYRGDAFRNLVHLHEGRAHFDPRCDAAYRVTEEGLWQGASDLQRRLANVLLLLNMDEYFGWRHYGLFALADARYRAVLADLRSPSDSERHELDGLAARLAAAERGRRTDDAGALISVLVPVYNHGRYVEAAVRSVLAQDWPRIELLAVDDGSADDSWAVLQRLREDCERRCERVVMERQGNCGTCETLNRLRSLARGDYVAILASDDQFLPGAFRALAEPMRERFDIVAVVGQNEIMDEEGRQCFWDDDRNAVYESERAKFRTFNEFVCAWRGVKENGCGYGDYRTLLRANHIVNGALIRKSAFDSIPPFTRLAPLEDYWLWLQLAKVGRCRAIPQATFRYRWHAANTIRQTARMGRFFDRVLAWEERSVEGNPDRRWFEAFRAECWQIVAERRLGRLIAYRKYATPLGKVRTLSVFGREIVRFRGRCRKETA